MDWILGLIGAGIGGAIAYGDLRYQIGKLKGKIEFIEKSMTVVMKNNGCEIPKRK